MTGPAASKSLSLTPPAAVPVVEVEQAEGMLPIPEARVGELQKMADAYVKDLDSLAPNSPELAAKVDEISRVGAEELRASANVSNRMLERPSSALAGTEGKSSSAPQAKVGKTLADLRRAVEELTPNQADLTPTKKILGFIPAGKRIDKYFDKYRSAQSQLDAITKSLSAGQDELRKDNAAIEQERANLWKLMGDLTEYAHLLNMLSDAVGRRADELESTDPSKATAFKSEVQFAVVQRHQDVLTQLAVAAQGYLAMDMVKKNNVELIKGVERARTTTLSALRTAVIVAEALTNQRLVLSQITALNTVTSNVIANNAAMLKQNSTDIQNQAASSSIDVAKLQQAFDDVFATMDAVDTFRAEAVGSMQQTVTALEGQLVKARPYLERASSPTPR
ncbi:toxic anion resistance protein [Rhodococcus sp. X156]|uniref:toxic anion resistance protein n=1 Tax=Rhodococcus sp. X156 TaxID=2499145 RepID=UPI000FDAB869|nr:toxic anion resistance protein [Rhodococcus sp. X156]